MKSFKPVTEGGPYSICHYITYAWCRTEPGMLFTVDGDMRTHLLSQLPNVIF